MTDDTISLSLRHALFVAEYLKDGNATRAYIRAGYSPRGAQPSASRLLRRPDIEAAVAAGRQRMVQALEVSALRVAQEYAKIAFASVGDYLSVDAEGRLRVDLDKASQAQRAGIIELKISDHRNREQSVTLKLGKLRALDALVRHAGLLMTKAPPPARQDHSNPENQPEPDPVVAARDGAEQREMEYRSLLDHSNEQKKGLERELAETRAALTEAQAMADPLGFGEPLSDMYLEDTFEDLANYGDDLDDLEERDEPEQPERTLPPIIFEGLGPPSS